MNKDGGMQGPDVGWDSSCLVVPQVLRKQHHCGGKKFQAILILGNKEENGGKIRLANENGW